MVGSGSLLAWIEQHGRDCFFGAYVGEDAGPDAARNYLGRAPAVRPCCSAEAARRWVTREASTLGLPVKWVDEAPWRRPDAVTGAGGVNKPKHRDEVWQMPRYGSGD